MICPKCKTDNAHRSHRRGLLELLASFVAILPYRCRDCSLRFLKFRYAAPGQSEEEPSPVREILSIRRPTAWRRKRLELFLYGAGMLLFLMFLYYISREHGGAPE
jgi:hypothetical protein